MGLRGYLRGPGTWAGGVNGKPEGVKGGPEGVEKGPEGA